MFCNLLRFLILILLVMPIVALWSLACYGNSQPSILLAATTSTYDSGLLDAVIPIFEQENNVDVDIVSIGSGQALALGHNGDLDVMLVHAPQLELQFVEDGFGVDRTFVMHNQFVILGPKNDPADIRGFNSAVEAFRTISADGHTFISRGDESGTHLKEKQIWDMLGLKGFENEDWYLSIGQGMGSTLTAANEQQAYVLSDLGTYTTRMDLSLEILVSADKLFYNPYHVMRLNPDRFEGIEAELAKSLIEYLISPECQRIINEFGVEKYGRALFKGFDTGMSEGQ